MMSESFSLRSLAFAIAGNHSASSTRTVRWIVPLVGMVAFQVRGRGFQYR